MSETLIIVIEPLAGKPGRYVARFGDTILAPASKSPFTAAARALIALGHPPDTLLISRRADSDVDCLRAKLGVAAGLVTKETDRAGPRFRKFDPTWVDGHQKAD